MENETDLQLLQLYRHHVMNELQVVNGYLQLENIECAQQNISRWIERLQEEQKLFHLNASHFITWLLFLNKKHPNIQIAYSINKSISIKHLDVMIANHCQQLIQMMETHLVNNKLYHIHMKIHVSANRKLYLTFYFQTPMKDEKGFLEKVQKFSDSNKLSVNFQRENKVLLCTWFYWI